MTAANDLQEKRGVQLRSVTEPIDADIKRLKEQIADIEGGGQNVRRGMRALSPEENARARAALLPGLKELLAKAEAGLATLS